MNSNIRKRTYTRGDKSSVRWIATIDDRSSGVRDRQSKSFKLEREAKEWVQAQLRRARLDAGREVDVATLLERWLAHIETMGREPRTLRGYRSVMDAHLIPKLGPVRLSVLSPLHVQRLVDQLAPTHSPQTVANVIAPLRAALNQAQRWRLVSENAAALVSLPRRDRDEVKPLSVDEAKAFIADVADYRMGPLFTVVVTLGLRQSEALALRWSDVDLEARTLTVVRKAYRNAGAYYVGAPKSLRSRRVIPLPHAIVEVLRTQRANVLRDRVREEQWEEQDLVFPNTSGGFQYGPYVTRAMQRRLKKIGIEGKRFHDLRHTAASALYAMGADVKEIMEVLGHSDVRITASLYTHGGAETRERTAARMDAWLG